MTEILHALQAIFVLAWSAPLVLFWRPALGRAHDACDRLAAATWFASLSVIAFPLRWLVQGVPVAHIADTDLVLWSFLYVTGTAGGAALTVAVRRVCHGR